MVNNFYDLPGQFNSARGVEVKEIFCPHYCFVQYNGLLFVGMNGKIVGYHGILPKMTYSFGFCR